MTPSRPVPALFISLWNQGRRLCLTGIFLASSLASAGPVGRTQPFLFLTPADCSRARQAVQENPVFAQLARDWVAHATTNLARDLPPLERAWWQIAQAKPCRAEERRLLG